LRKNLIFEILLVVFVFSVTFSAGSEENWSYMVNSSYVDSQYLDGNNLWLATFGGIVCYDVQTNEMKQWTRAEGIYNHIVKSIKVDRYGNVWCYCINGNGLWRKSDDWQFFGEEQGLPSVTGFILALNKNGELWVGAYDEGIFAFNYEENRFEQKFTDSSRFITFDNDNNLWKTVYKDGAYKYENVEWEHFNSDDGLPSDNIDRVFFDSAGNVWFSYWGGGAGPTVKWDGETMTTYNYKDNGFPGYVHDMAEDSQGNLWFACNWYDIFMFDGESFTPYDKDFLQPGYPEGEPHYCNSLSITPDDTIWVGTHDGIKSFKKDMPKADHYKLRKDYPFENYFTAMGIADDNTVWLGDQSGFLASFNGEEWTEHFDPRSGNYQVKDFLFSPGGDVWIAAYTGIRHCFPNGEWEWIEENGDINLNGLQSILIDRNGALWATAYIKCIYRLDGENWTHITKSEVESEGPIGDSVYDVAEDGSGNLWFAGSGGVSMYDGNTWKWYTNEDGLISDKKVRSVLIDDQGYFWFGTEEGVSRFDGYDKWVNYSKDDVLCGNEIMDIFQDSKGNIWFACFDGGASKYDGVNWTSYTAEKCLPDKDVVEICEDKNNDIWFAISGENSWAGGIAILHEAESLYPVVNIYTDKGRYRSGDTINVSIDGNNMGEGRETDIYIVMLDPSQDIYFASSWDGNPVPVLSNIFIPGGFLLPETTIFDFAIPNMKPPIGSTGDYIFAIGLTEPGKLDFYHISSANYDVIE